MAVDIYLTIVCTLVALGLAGFIALAIIAFMGLVQVIIEIKKKVDELLRTMGELRTAVEKVTTEYGGNEYGRGKV